MATEEASAMRQTRLILIEGIPGSGKSTTARNLCAAIQQSGIGCQYFHEWASNHPISIGPLSQLATVIASSQEREAHVAHQWAAFVTRMRPQHTVTIIEARFWQTTLQFMYLAGHPAEAVVTSQQRVMSMLSPLQPVFILLAPTAVRQALVRTIHTKSTQRNGMDEEVTWEQMVCTAVASQFWAKERGLTGREALYQFAEAWSSLAERLYQDIPFPKISVENPHTNWEVTMGHIRTFVGLHTRSV
jgi:thymidylate kinase